MNHEETGSAPSLTATQQPSTSAAEKTSANLHSAVVAFDPSTDPAAVALTAAAAQHLSKTLSGTSATAVRLGVTESGCNGYMYDLSFAESINSDDHRYAFPVDTPTAGSITLVVSRQDLPLVQGTQVDYVTVGLNSALKFSNPNADTHCGCGESFSVSAPETV